MRTWWSSSSTKFRRGCAPNPRRPLAGTPSPRAASAEARCARLAASAPPLQSGGGFAPSPRRPLAGIPSPRAASAEARCARLAASAPPLQSGGGFAPSPRRPLAGIPSPRAASAEARCARLAASAPPLQSGGGCASSPGVRLRGGFALRRFAEACCAQLHSNGASPRAPGVRLRGSLRPAPLPPRRAVRALRRLRRRSNQAGAAPRAPAFACGGASPRAAFAEACCAGFHQTGLRPGLRPEPPASACGDPFAPHRFRRGALCAASFRRGCAPNPRRPLAGTPSPRAASAEARCAQLHSDGASPRTPGVRLRGALRPAPLPPRRAVRALGCTGSRSWRCGARRA